MPNQLTNRDKLDIAINGSQQFHEKTASSNGNIQPDPVTEGHREMAIQLAELADQLTKTAGLVDQGYPVKLALAHVVRQAGADEEWTQKLASFVDELGNHVLEELVLETFQNKVQAKVAQAPNRVQASVQRFQQLGALPKK